MKTKIDLGLDKFLLGRISSYKRNLQKRRNSLEF